MALTHARKVLSRCLPLALLSLPMACVGPVGAGWRAGPGERPGEGPAKPGERPRDPDGTPSAPGAPTGPSGMPTAPTPSVCKGLNVGPSPVRRMTHVEYNNAVADLLGDKTQPARTFP